MKPSSTQNFALLVNDLDALSVALNIGECAPSLQMKIIDEWAGLLFKRLLLLVPEERVADMQQMISDMHAEGKDTTELFDFLAQSIPDFSNQLNIEIARALDEFRIEKAL